MLNLLVYVSVVPPIAYPRSTALSRPLHDPHYWFPAPSPGFPAPLLDPVKQPPLHLSNNQGSPATPSYHSSLSSWPPQPSTIVCSPHALLSLNQPFHPASPPQPAAPAGGPADRLLQRSQRLIQIRIVIKPQTHKPAVPLRPRCCRHILEAARVIVFNVQVRCGGFGHLHMCYDDSRWAAAAGRGARGGLR